MQQRKSTLGRPSGTDGSDYSYRMGINWLQRGRTKKRLSMLFIIEALFLLIGGIFAYLPGIEEDAPNTVASSSVTVGVVLLIIANLGRKQVQFVEILRCCIIYSNASLSKHHSLLKAIQDFNFLGTREFDVNDFPGYQTGSLVYILTLSLLKIFTIRTVVSLLFNMSPPKKAS